MSSAGVTGVVIIKGELSSSKCTWYEANIVLKTRSAKNVCHLIPTPRTVLLNHDCYLPGL